MIRYFVTLLACCLASGCVAVSKGDSASAERILRLEGRVAQLESESATLRTQMRMMTDGAASPGGPSTEELARIRGILESMRPAPVPAQPSVPASPEAPVPTAP
jgi:outer membrane murein-binding lipoprotein Lpp